MAASMKFGKTAFSKVLQSRNCINLSCNRLKSCYSYQICNGGIFKGALAVNGQYRSLHISSPCWTDEAKSANVGSRAVPNTYTSVRRLHSSRRCLSTENREENVETIDVDTVEEPTHQTIITNTERRKGKGDKHEFQAETRKLLDIVAKSLYSEKEVFVREIVSNCSDALEKLRYMQSQNEDLCDPDLPLEIHIEADDNKHTLTIQDTGVGLTREELISNLGTIARSGSKAFLEEMKAGGNVDKSIIGQFGVGFYSTFMVGDKIEVFTRSYKPDSLGLHWVSDGLGSYEVTEAEGVQRGTKVVIHLKGDSQEFSKEEMLNEIIKKYSNFVGVPIILNGKRINVVEALWCKEPRSVTPEEHEDFYRFIGNAYDRPRYLLHYRADAPLDIKALFYVPDTKPSMFDMSRDTDISVSLYSRKVMIMAKANHILPRWLRFLRGVVDSEDIPLNLSRELLQDSNLIRKIRWVLTNRLIKFFQEQSRKDPEKYLKFYDDYGLFFREGIVTTPEQETREDIAKLLRFDSSALEPDMKTSIDQYATRMEAGTRTIYYLSAPNRQLAESSPYMEAMKKKGVEVLFCFEPYDELVLMNLGQFDKKNFKSIENEMVEDTKSDKVDESDDNSLKQADVDGLLGWLQVTLGQKVTKTKVTNRLEAHPCMITVPEMGAARHFLKTTLADRSEEEKYRVLQPVLEINPKHPIIHKLATLKDSDPELAQLVTHQLYDNALIAAGLIDDPRSMLTRINDILTRALDKH